MTNHCDLITDFVRVMNTRNEQTLAALFAEHAVVRDGGLEYRGPAEIKYWIQNAFEKDALNLEVINVSGQGEVWFFEALVSGSFEGSPVHLEHRLTIQNGKISNLDI